MKKLLILLVSIPALAEEVSNQFSLPQGRGLHIALINENGHTMVQYNHMAQTNVVPTPKMSSEVKTYAPTTMRPWLWGAGLIAGGYAALIGYLKYAEWAMHVPGSWAAWKQERSLRQLKELPQQQLARELFAEIQARCRQKSNVLAPLMAFMEAVEGEQKAIERFITVKNLITRTHLDRIFPAQKIALANADENLQRLAYLKETLLQWLSEYSVA